MSKVITGSKTAIKLTLQPLSSAIEATAAAAVATPCAPAISGLFWFSDSTGQFDQAAEAAYLLAAESASPALGVAALLGEGCGLPVTWTMNWVPDTGTGGDPGILEDGQRLVVFQSSTTVPGALTVTAEHNGQVFGPIVLTLTAASTGGSGSEDWISILDNTYWSASYSENPTGSGWDGAKWVFPMSSYQYIYLDALFPATWRAKRIRIRMHCYKASEGIFENGFWVLYIQSTDPLEFIANWAVEQRVNYAYLPGENVGQEMPLHFKDTTNGIFRLMMYCYSSIVAGDTLYITGIDYLA